MSEQSQKNSQENMQDLPQNQQVDVKTSQVNEQRIDIIINTKLENYAAKITGSVYSNNDLIPSAFITLYFGYTSTNPIYKTTSDLNGNFTIEELPPGFYTLTASIDRDQGTIINIKLMPGQNYECSIHLSTDKIQ